MRTCCSSDLIILSCGVDIYCLRQCFQVWGGQHPSPLLQVGAPGLSFSTPLPPTSSHFSFRRVLMADSRGSSMSQPCPIKYSGSGIWLLSRKTACSIFLTTGWLLRRQSLSDLAAMSSRASLVSDLPDFCILSISKSLLRNPSLSFKLSWICILWQKWRKKPNWYIGKHFT